MRSMACLMLALLTLPAAAEQAVTDRLTIELGRPAFLGIRLAQKASSETSLKASSSDPKLVSVAPSLQLLAGHRLAFLTLTPHAIGRVTIRVGKASCKVSVTAQALPPTVQILTPAPGAVLWGEVALQARAFGQSEIVRIEWWLDGRLFHRTQGKPLADGRLSAEGKPGAHELVARAIDAAGRVGQISQQVIFADPGLGDPKRSVKIEAEAMGQATAAAGINPVAPTINQERGASGGKVASLYSQAQLLQHTLTVPQAGYYQLILKARADVYLAAPSVTLIIDNKATPSPAFGPITAAGSLARHGVGAPFLLRPGKRKLTIYFYNDAYDPVTRSDRNLHVDQVEIRHMGAVRPDAIAPTVVLATSLAGQEAGGGFTVLATARDDSEQLAELWLLIDGVRVPGTRTGEYLTYQVPADALTPGNHTLRAEARDHSGNVGRSARLLIQRLPYSGAAAEAHRLYASQGVASGRKIAYDRGAIGSQSWMMYSGGNPVRFPLEIRRPGEYQLQLYARADLYQGPPTARIIARSGGKEVARVELDVTSTVYSMSAAATLKLPHGQYQLSVEFINDQYGGTAETDRNLHLAGLSLWRKSADRQAPWSEIISPAPGALLRGSEMIVARASDNGQVALVELLVDGQVVSRSGNSGRVWLWLHGDRLEPGEHTLQLRVTDRQGNRGLSGPRRIRLARGSAALSRTERGIALLRRLGLGANPADLADLLAQGETRWLERQLAPSGIDDSFADFWEATLNRNNLVNQAQLRYAVIAHALYTRRPVRERMAHFFDNHFSTWIGKTGVTREWIELYAFRALSLGSFRNMLLSSATSPTMLAYLDNTTNRRGKLNENYAREIMELHTLGVDGGYSQQDVEQVARIFTGWTATLGHPYFHFAFDSGHHDTGPKLALGTRFASGNKGQDAQRLIGILAAHPATARFIARKLIATLIAEDPPQALVARTARSFMRSGGDMASVLRSLVAAPEFFDRKHFGTKISDPFEFVVGLARNRHIGADYSELDNAMNRMGQPLFGRVTPDGYPERGGDWLNAATLLTRWNFAEHAAGEFLLDAPVGPRVKGQTLESLADDLSMSLIGRRLGPGSLKILRAAFPDPSPCNRLARIRAVAALILQLPEAQRN